MVSRKIGSLFYFGERILMGCKGLVAEAHSHYAVSLLLSIDEPFQVLNKEGILAVCEAILIPPNYHHTLLAENSKMVVLQFDPKSLDFQSLKESADVSDPVTYKIDTFFPILSDLRRLLDAELDCDSAWKLYFQILTCFGAKDTKPLPHDSRMKTALQLMEERLPDSIRVSDLAQKIGLSEDRFMHWFKEQFGIPLRQYLLWRRLHIAASLLQTGASLTEASHAAGFSDQSHLSKTFRKMFGVPPSRFLGGNENFKVCFCTKNLSGL